MGLIRNELLSLDLIPTAIATSSCYVPKSITDFVKDVSSMDDFDDKLSKFDEFINSLTEEMKKIDAFKRELPLCIVLLHDAANYLRKECEVVCKTRNVKPVLEEFIPMKKDDEKEGDEILLSSKKKDNNLNNNRDKKNWMRSFQLWNTSDVNSSTESPNSPKGNGLKQESNSAQRDRGEAHEFKLLKEFPPFAIPFRDARRKENKERPVVDAFSFLDPTVKNLREKSGSSGLDASCNRALFTASPGIQSSFRSGTPQPHLQNSRKQRRCWSPDLHRRFVNALQQLGGSQVATPKQIRELMQVDGLTNDEVKSHLQKYRLHIKRTPGSQPATSGNQCGESSKNSSNSLSASPEGPLQPPGNTRGTLTTGDDSMEDEEDDKSETFSWKSNIHNPGRDDAYGRRLCPWNFEVHI